MKTWSDFGIDLLDLPATRAQALALGIKYYRGRGCSKGHEGPRFTSNGGCWECSRKHCVTYHQRHLKSERARKRQWANDNPQRNLQQSAKWATMNREKTREINHRASKKHYHKDLQASRLRSRIYAATRRARQRQAGGRFAEADVLRMLQQQHGRCYWCKRPCGKQFDVDHIVPLCRGGANSLPNLCIACPLCNAEKAGKMPEDYAGRWF